MLNIIIEASENFCIHQIRVQCEIVDDVSEMRTVIASIDIELLDGKKQRVYIGATLDFAQRIATALLEEDESDEEEEPETLTPQIPVLLDLLDAFGIPMLGVDDYEADDVMATFAVKEKGPIRVVTGDRDLFQMVDDKRDVKIVYLARGISQHDLVDSKWVAEKYGIPGDRYALFAMFRGDPSDGLPGVRGIGEKGAALIANHFSTVDEALAGAKAEHEALTKSLAKKIIDGADYLRIAPTLVHCAKDVAIPKMDISMPKKPDDLSTIYQMKDEYGLGASVDRLISALGW